MVNELGLIQIYTGDGKGKTTAAMGLAIRAAGAGYTCLIIHFMKSDIVSGEDRVISSIKNIDVKRIGDNFIGDSPPSHGAVKNSLVPALIESKKAVSGKYDLVVLDEILVARSFNLITESEIFEIIESKAEKTELILTGRGATEALIEAADLVTEMRELKHPYVGGRQARAGIEF